MEINIATPALLFPAISLLLLAYTNRFIALATIVRQLNQSTSECDRDSRLRQIKNLKLRLSIIKTMQAMGVLGMIACVIAMIFIFQGLSHSGEMTFVSALFFMLVSLVFALWEILLSGQALKVELENINFN